MMLPKLIFAKTFICCVAATFSLSQPLYAANEISVIPAERRINTEGRGIFTLRFEIENRSGSQQELQEVINLPQGWQLITTPAPFIVATGTREIRFIHITTSGRARTGTYPITYNIAAINNGGINGTEIVAVIVKEQPGISISSLGVPSSLLAGESYSVDFLVKNTGNKTSSFKININDEDGYVKKVSPSKLLLKPNKTAKVTIKGVAPTSLRETITHRVDLLVKGSGISKKESISIPMIAPTPKGLSLYQQLVGQLKVSYTGGKDNNAVQLDYAAKGSLDKDGKHKIAVKLRNGGNSNSSTNLTQAADYQVSYEHDAWGLRAGHQSFNASQLSGNSLSGIGLEARYAPIDEKYQKKVEVRVFQGQSRSGIANKEKVQGIVGRYRFDNGIEIGGSTLKSEKINEKNLLINAINGAWIGDKFTLKSEIARDDDALASRIDLSSQWNDLGASISYLDAEPNFDGSQTDTQQLFAGLDYRLDDRSRISVNRRQIRNNLDKDQSKEIRDDHEDILRLSRSLWDDRSGEISLDYRAREEEDLRVVSSRKSKTETQTLTYRHTFDTLSVQTIFGTGERNDNIENRVDKASKKSVSLSWNPSKKYNMGGNYSIDNSFSDEGENTQIGLNLAYKPNKRSQLFTAFSSSENTGAKSTSDNLQVRYEHTFRNDHKLGLSATYTNSNSDIGDDKSDMAWRVEYTMPLGIPIRRRDNIGSLSGKAYFADTQKPASDLVLQLDGQYAVTNKKGEFFYPNIVAKDYQIQLDSSRDGQGYMLGDNGQTLDLNIEANKTKYIKLALKQGVALTGQILTFSADTQSALGDDVKNKVALKAEQGLGGILVELKPIGDDQRQIQKRISTSNGSFSFLGLASGQWQLSVLDEKKLPENYRLEKKQYLVDLKKGASEDITIKVVPTSQVIKKIGPSGGFNVSE